MKVLILCTGNTCRSQMAEGILRALDPSIDVKSAGTKAESRTNPYAIEVMQEIGIDISHQQPKSVNLFVKDAFDFVITVCDGAKEICPVFTGNVKHRLHIGFPDPANAKGSRDEILPVYRSVRDSIKQAFDDFYKEHIMTSIN